MKTNYKKACDLLGISYDLPEVSKISQNHAKAIQSIYKLMIIAEAMNKEDEFVPDYDDKEQLKWRPRFHKKNSGFAFDASDFTCLYAIVGGGSRFSFKTRVRSGQFGLENIDLWNDYLLFNN